MSAIPATIPTLTVDLPCLVEQLHRTGSNAESAQFAFTMARDVRRRSPWTVLRYYARLHEIGAAEIASLCAVDFARALLADRAAVAEALESAGREWEGYYA